MNKKFMIPLIIAVMLFGLTKISYAMMCGGGSGHSEHSQAAEPSAQEAVNAGNKICPVSGEEINQDTKATYEYGERIYNLCCASCIGSFKKDPRRYVKKVGEELTAGPEVSGSMGGHKH